MHLQVHSWPPLHTNATRPLMFARVGVCIGCPKGYDRSLLFERHIPFLRVGGTKGRLMPADRETWREAHDLETVR